MITMHPDQPTPCDGDTRFESENTEVHADIKAACNDCYFRAGCQRLLEQTILEYGLAHGPRGTWAGKLYRDPAIDRRKAVADCGTRSGYQAHRKRGEESCVPCRAAEADYKRTRKADKETAA